MACSRSRSQDEIDARIPLGRMASIDEIADAFVYLASPLDATSPARPSSSTGGGWSGDGRGYREGVVTHPDALADRISASIMTGEFPVGRGCARSGSPSASASAASRCARRCARCRRPASSRSSRTAARWSAGRRRRRSARPTSCGRARGPGRGARGRAALAGDARPAARGGRGVLGGDEPGRRTRAVWAETRALVARQRPVPRGRSYMPAGVRVLTDSIHGLHRLVPRNLTWSAIRTRRCWTTTSSSTSACSTRSKRATRPRARRDARPCPAIGRDGCRLVRAQPESRADEAGERHLRPAALPAAGLGIQPRVDLDRGRGREGAPAAGHRHSRSCPDRLGAARDGYGPRDVRRSGHRRCRSTRSARPDFRATGIRCPTLAAHDLAPDDLALAAASHLHIDHAGGLRHLAGVVPVAVQRRELEFATTRPGSTRRTYAATMSWTRSSGSSSTATPS